MVVAFILGIAVGRALEKRTSPLIVSPAQNPDLAGIEKLHQLDERITLLNDPKALQQEWTDDAVRMEPDGPVNVGKAAIYASDLRSLAEAPGSAIVSYKPDIRDVQVIDGDCAVEWGLFDAEFRESASKPVEAVHGKVLRVLHRESKGDWKFSRVMVVWNQNH